MALTIDEAQAITDLRVRMLSNLQAGKAAHDGLTPEEYKNCLDAIRGNRAIAVANGIAKAKGGRKKAAAAPAEPGVSVLANPKFAKFSKFNLD